MTTSSFWAGPVRGGAPSAEQAASMAGLIAAGNLFEKVVGALALGDEEKARRTATLVARRPFDDFEEVWPGPTAARYALFQLVTDTVDELPEDDDTWVAVLDDIASGVSGRQLDELHHLAAVLHQDADFLGIGEREAGRLKVIAGGADPKVWPGDDVPEDQHGDYVLELAHLYVALEARLVDALA